MAAELNPLRAAQREGMQAVNDLGLLFGRLGTTAHPNSETLIAYRNANRALKETLKSGGGLTDVREITGQLKKSVKASVGPIFRVAAEQGYKNAGRQLKSYRVSPPDPPDMTEEIAAAYSVIDANLQRQEAAIAALMLSGSDETLITGDENRQGVLRSGEILLAGAFWLASLWWLSFDRTAERAAGGGFQKQAVAALDARTTDCCLRVHGQIQPLNAPFELTGTPRYADALDWPPFHGWCRTSGVLYRASYDEGLTERMTDSAAQVLAERAQGIIRDRHPADAFI